MWAGVFYCLLFLSFFSGIVYFFVCTLLQPLVMYSLKEAKKWNRIRQLFRQCRNKYTYEIRKWKTEYLQDRWTSFLQYNWRKLVKKQNKQKTCMSKKGFSTKWQSPTEAFGKTHYSSKVSQSNIEGNDDEVPDVLPRVNTCIDLLFCLVLM